MKLLAYLVFFLSCVFSSSLIAKEEIASHEYFDQISSLYHDKNWDGVIADGKLFLKSKPENPFLGETYFFIGVGYFHQGDFEFANDYFNKYLRESSSSKHFDEAMNYRFDIAEEFRLGAKKRMFKWQKSPVYLSGLSDALEIYEEVIQSFPYTDLAVKALYSKGMVLMEFEDDQDSIESFELLIKRFPKHELAIESYLAIARVYLFTAEEANLDPELLQRAEGNVQKFEKNFPGEERLSVARSLLFSMQEAYAKSLYETGRFFERTKKPKAAIIYYSKALSNYPETDSAKKAGKRLERLSQDGHQV